MPRWRLTKAWDTGQGLVKTQTLLLYGANGQRRRPCRPKEDVGGTSGACQTHATHGGVAAIVVIGLRFCISSGKGDRVVAVYRACSTVLATSSRSVPRSFLKGRGMDASEMTGFPFTVTSK